MAVYVAAPDIAIDDGGRCYEGSCQDQDSSFTHCEPWRLPWQCGTGLRRTKSRGNNPHLYETGNTGGSIPRHGGARSMVGPLSFTLPPSSLRLLATTRSLASVKTTLVSFRVSPSLPASITRAGTFQMKGKLGRIVLA